jgi:capsular polysaccharide transport system permease protein
MTSQIVRALRTSGQFGLSASMRQYGRVMFALLQKQMEQRRRAPLEAVADVLEPLMFVALLTVLWTFLNRRTSSPLGDDAVLFIGTGFYAKFFWISLSKMSRRVIGIPERRFPIERRLDYIFVHVVMTTGEYLLLALAGFGIVYFFFTTAALPYKFAPAVLAMLAIIGLGFGWGIITLVITKYFWPWGYLSGLFNRAMILFSGIFFLAEFLPPTARYVLSFNPMLHAVALFRTGFYPSYPKLLLDTNYLVLCTLAAVFIGFVLERVTLRSERHDHSR